MISSKRPRFSAVSTFLAVLQRLEEESARSEFARRQSLRGLRTGSRQSRLREGRGGKGERLMSGFAFSTLTLAGRKSRTRVQCYLPFCMFVCQSQPAQWEQWAGWAGAMSWEWEGACLSVCAQLTCFHAICFTIPLFPRNDSCFSV